MGLQQHDSCPGSNTSSSRSSLSGLSEAQPTVMTTMSANDCFDGSALFSGGPSTATTPARLQHPLPVTQQTYPSQSSRLQDMSDLASCNVQPQATARPSGLTTYASRCDRAAVDTERQGGSPTGCSGAAKAMTELPQSSAVHMGPSRRSAEVTSAQEGSCQDESEEGFMTLEELEARIASLNQTLLQAPAECRPRSPPTFAMRPSVARSKSPGSPRFRAVAHRAALPVRPSSAHSRSPGSPRLRAVAHRAALPVRPSSAHGTLSPPESKQHSADHTPAGDPAAAAAFGRPMSPLSQPPLPRHDSASTSKIFSTCDQHVSAQSRAASWQNGAASRQMYAPVRHTSVAPHSAGVSHTAPALHKLQQQHTSQHRHDSAPPVPAYTDNSRPGVQQLARNVRNNSHTQQQDGSKQQWNHSMQQSDMSLRGVSASFRHPKGGNSSQYQTSCSSSSCEANPGACLKCSASDGSVSGREESSPSNRVRLKWPCISSTRIEHAANSNRSQVVPTKQNAANHKCTPNPCFHIKQMSA